MADEKSRGVVETKEGVIWEVTRRQDNGVRAQSFDGLRQTFIPNENIARLGGIDYAKKSGDVTVKIDVDVSEALTGLKAIQREAREAAKALRELEAESGKVSKVNELRDIQGTPGNYDVSDYMTGLFNGLELASATLEGRDPEYKPCRPDDAYYTKTITDDIRRSYE